MATRTKTAQPRFKLSLDDIRAEVKAVREQGLKIQSHYKKLDQEYSDWEDRLNKLDTTLNQAETELGLTKREILTDATPFDDIIKEETELSDDEIIKAMLEELS